MSPMSRAGLLAAAARGEAGQAMAEYAIIVASLLGVLAGVGYTFLPDFIEALQQYYDNFYIILSLPIP